jgi:ribosome modulation factor
MILESSTRISPWLYFVMRAPFVPFPHHAEHPHQLDDRRYGLRARCRSDLAAAGFVGLTAGRKNHAAQVSEPIFSIELINEIRLPAHEAYLSGKTVAACPFLTDHERDIWLSEFRKAQFEQECG